jgi:hypothetical protein
MSIFLCRFCGKWIGEYFLLYFEQSVDFSVVVQVLFVGEMFGEKGLCWSSNGAELRTQKFLDKSVVHIRTGGFEWRFWKIK